MAKRQQVDTRSSLELQAWAELSYLSYVRVLPETFDKARIAIEDSTPIYDLNGELLFYRVPVSKDRDCVGYADVAAHPALGEALLSVSMAAFWDEKALLDGARKAARALRIKGLERATLRFVAYSYPKLAVEFLVQGKERLMLELFTWIPVPASKRTMHWEPPSNFERWSLLDELPDDEAAPRVERFEKRRAAWSEGFRQVKKLELIDRDRFIEVLKPVRPIFVATRELHYSTRPADHFTCYELRGQETNVWCVGASVQMLLDFYRYEYTQVRLATELGLGTLDAPNGLPYSRVGDVVTVLEALTSNALDATMHVSPTFSLFQSEINANRPLISFVPGHSRTVAGYTRTFTLVFGASAFRGLLVYDPWPPNAGVITRWENFDATTHQYAYSGVLRRP